MPSGNSTCSLSHLREEEADTFSKYKEEFIPADRVTDADRKQDVRSLQRSLQHTLMLITKTKSGWEVPTVVLGKGETLRDVRVGRMLACCFLRVGRNILLFAC